LYAIVYYAEHFEIFCSVVNAFDMDDTSCTAILQEIFNDSKELRVLKSDLVYIHANFSFLSHSINKLEETTNLLSEVFKLNQHTRQN
jgi:hypothetical protein